MASVQVIPPPTDPYELLQWNMIHAHDPFKVGLERIETLLKDPPLDDIKNFLGYLEAWAKSIVTHHDTEELSVFPFLSQRMDLSHEKDDHKAIHSGLTAFIEYIAESQKNPSSFDAAKAASTIEEMKPVLLSHLDSEVEHISAEKMREAGFTEKELNKMLQSLTDEAKKHGDPFLLLPFMISHTPPEHKSFPVAPWIIKKVLIPYIFARRYSGYWKYAPYAMS